MSATSRDVRHVLYLLPPWLNLCVACHGRIWTYCFSVDDAQADQRSRRDTGSHLWVSPLQWGLIQATVFICSHWSWLRYDDYLTTRLKQLRCTFSNPTRGDAPPTAAPWTPQRPRCLANSQLLCSFKQIGGGDFRDEKASVSLRSTYSDRINSGHL